MEHFIHENGYLAVFLTVAFSGEFGLIAGVALARSGSVTLTGVVILGTIASFIGNMFYYFVGKFLWNKWHFLKKRFGGKVERSSRLVRHYGSPLMLFSRFFYGVRNIVPIALGLYEVKMGTFAVYNVVGAFVWAWAFTEAGGLVSDYFGEGVANFRNLVIVAAAVMMVLGALYILIRRLVSRLDG